MDMTHTIVWARESLRMALILGGPLLAAAFVVGLLIGIGQTMTQIHEPVVAMVPRLLVVAVVLSLILPWLLGGWVSFASDLIGSIPELVSS